MFWGVTIEPEKKYKQTVTKTFHLSMATLELNSHDKEPVSLMLDYDNQEYVLCNLQQRIPGSHPGILNCPLDLNFQAGERIAFYATGKSNVHLSGYIVDDDDMDLSDEEEEEEEEDVSSKVISPKKRKESQSTSVRKKQKVEAAESSDDEEEEETTSSMKLQLAGSEEDEDDDDDDEDDDEEEDDDDDEEEEESEDENMQISSAKKAGNNQATKKKKSDQTLSKSPIPNGQTPKSEKKKQGNQTPKGTPQVSSESGTPQKKVLSGGVIVQDVKIGNGPVAKAGSKVTVYYVGRLKNNNKQFDSTTSGPGFAFTLGRKEVIKGWDIGVPGMKVGGKRTVTVPPVMAYGKKGLPPVIPPNSVLVFDVELRGVN